MPPRQLLFRIQDILDALEAIRAYTVGMEFPDFVADRRTVDAVIRNLAIIGEAASHIPDEVCAALKDLDGEEACEAPCATVNAYLGSLLVHNAACDGTQCDGD